MPTRKNHPHRRRLRQQEAIERQQVHDSLSTLEKMDKVKSRRGMSLKEFARLRQDL